MARAPFGFAQRTAGVPVTRARSADRVAVRGSTLPSAALSDGLPERRPVDELAYLDFLGGKPF